MQKHPSKIRLTLVSSVNRESETAFTNQLSAMCDQTFSWFEWIVLAPFELSDSLRKTLTKDGRVKIITDTNSWKQLIMQITAEIVVFLPKTGVPCRLFLEYGYWGLRCAKDISVLFIEAMLTENKINDSPQNLEQSPIFFRREVFLRNFDTLPQAFFCIWQWASQEKPSFLSKPLFCNSTGTLSENRIPSSAHVPLFQPEQLDCFHPIITEDWPANPTKDTNKTHFLILAPWMQMGGADKFNLDLLRGLSQKGYQVSIATTLADENVWEDLFLEVTPDVFCLADFLDRKDFPSFLHYLIQSREINVLMVSNSAYGYYMIPWLRAQFPDLTVVDYVHMPEKSWRSGGYARQSGYLSEFLDKTYTCNNTSRKQLIAEYNHAEGHVETVYVGVDTDYFSPDTVPALSVCQLLGIEKDRPLVLFPCRMAAQKRPFLMLEIARIMRDMGSAAAFVLVGDGPDVPEMKAYIETHALQNTVYWAGSHRDMRPFYRDAVLTLICSLYEGLSLTAYESMAMQTPVVTSGVGGQAELVTSATGAVIPLFADEAKDLMARSFDPKEISLYIQTITHLLNDREMLKKCGQLARQRVLNGFTIQGMVNQLDCDIQEILRLKKENTTNPTAQLAPVLLYEEMAILAGEFAKRETVVLQQHRQLVRLLESNAVPPVQPTLAARMWQLAAPMLNRLDRIPLLRFLLTRNWKAKNE